MSIVKVIEVIAESKEGWDEAAQVAVATASKTLRNIRSIYIQDLQGTVEDGRITNFRVNAKISFVLEDEGD